MELKQSFKKYGWEFTLYKSEFLGLSKKRGLKRYKAIYIGLDKDVPNRQNIEVVILKEGFPTKFSKKKENWIKYPRTAEWGHYGWTYASIEKATKKYKEITANQYNVLKIRDDQA